MKQLKELARFGSASTALVAAVALILAVHSYLVPKKISVVLPPATLDAKSMVEFVVFLVFLATSIGFLFLPRPSAVVALAATAALFVLFLVFPVHASASKGLGLLLAGPILSSIAVLRHRSDARTN